MPYLFDTDAISELLRPRPAAAYVRWVRSVPREQQYASAVSMGEMYQGAYRSTVSETHLSNIESRVLPAISVLPYDVGVAKVFGRIRAELETAGKSLPDADLQIAATALHHGLELVTGNVKHFERVTGLVVNRVLSEAREI